MRYPSLKFSAGMLAGAALLGGGVLIASNEHHSSSNITGLVCETDEHKRPDKVYSYVYLATPPTEKGEKIHTYGPFETHDEGLEVAQSFIALGDEPVVWCRDIEN